MKISITETVFWVCFCAVAYTYLAYPVLLFVLASAAQVMRDVSYLIGRRDRRQSCQEEFLPRAAVLVSAHNEESVIEAKIQNTRELDYPSDHLEFLLGLDAPSDLTPERASRTHSPSVQIFNFALRRGKLLVLQDLAQRTSADILVLSDANTMLKRDCLRKLIRHFVDPSVGAVSGEEVRVAANGTKAPMASLYWRYEAALKILESRLNCALGANGAVYAIRRHLFRLKKNWIVEDFQIPMDVRFGGHRVIYDPEARAIEDVAPTLAAEFQRKVRIGAGDYQTLLGNPRFLNPLKGLPAFAYWSHKVLRWLAPLFLIGALASNLLLVLRPFYAGVFMAQCAFYLLATLGYGLQRHGKLTRLTSVPLYFSLMNLALLLGMFRFLSGRQEVVWSATPRRVPSGPVVESVGREGHD